MFNKPAKANRTNLYRRLDAAEEALHHAQSMLADIVAEGTHGIRRRDKRAEKAMKPLDNAYQWLLTAKRTFG